MFLPWGRSAGSYPEQRLVIEPIIAWYHHMFWNEETNSKRASVMQTHALNNVHLKIRIKFSLMNSLLVYMQSSALTSSLLTLTTFLMLLILLVNKLCMRRSSFTWSACLMHMNRMCAGSPGIASAMDLGFISVMRCWITLSSSSTENSIIPRTLCCLNWGGRGRRSYGSKKKHVWIQSRAYFFLNFTHNLLLFVYFYQP